MLDFWSKFTIFVSGKPKQVVFFCLNAKSEFLLEAVRFFVCFGRSVRFLEI